MQFFPAVALLIRDLSSCVDASINNKRPSGPFHDQLLSTEHMQIWGLFVGFGSYCIPLCETLFFACPLRKEVQCRDLSANPYKKACLCDLTHSVIFISDTAVPWCASTTSCWTCRCVHFTLLNYEWKAVPSKSQIILQTVFKREIVCLVKLQISKVTNGSCLSLHNGLNFDLWNKHCPRKMQFLGSLLMCKRGKLTLEMSSVGDGLSPVQIDSKAHSSSTGIGHNQSFTVKQPKQNRNLKDVRIN